jgi:4-amino-4-deoxy-L-arabinose transferase and related glycosyltransferases of PMT family
MATQIEIAEPEIITIGTEQSRADTGVRYFCYGALILVVVVFGFVRIRLRNTPLERDEGEYAYAGQLMLQGIPPYQLAYNMKLPGTYAAYAIMMRVFGETVSGIRIGMLFVLLGNTLILFLLTRRLFGLLAATVASASYTLLANRLSTMSLDGHATHFIVLASLSGILLLLHAIESQRRTTLFLSGFCFGLAFLMKQHGILFAVFGGLFLAWSIWKQSASWRKIIAGEMVLAAGVVVPFIVTCALIWHTGLFRKFWFWTINYAAAYEKILDLSEGWKLLQIILPWVPRPYSVFLIAALGLSAIFWNRRAREEKVFVLSFTLFSLLAVCPGFYFRPHYFLVLLPAVAMLAGLGISAAHEYLQEHQASPLVAWIPIAIFVICYFAALEGQRKYLFQITPLQVNRQMHGGHGFPEAQVVADYIRTRTTEKDRIAIFGSEPEIFFYSGRHSATGYIYMYPLMEHQKFADRMQSAMRREIEKSQPRIVVFADNQFSWGWRREWHESEPTMKIFSWMRSYLTANYDLIAEVPIDSARYQQWGAPCRYYVYQRK